MLKIGQLQPIRLHPTLRLSDVLPAKALQQIAEGFHSATGLTPRFVNADDPAIGTRQNDPAILCVAPIEFDGRCIGAAILEKGAAGAEGGGETEEGAAAKFIQLIAQVIAHAGRQEAALRRRIREGQTMYELSTILAGQRDLQDVLNVVCKSAAEVLGVKAASIRLYDPQTDELTPKGVYNLSDAYLNKGPILLESSAIDLESRRGGLVYVADMSQDSRILYPADAKREGLTSILSAALIYRGAFVGSMRIYTEQPRTFTQSEKDLLRAIAQSAAGAITNATLHAERLDAVRMQRQVELAADVQRRLMPVDIHKRLPPSFPFDIAGRYEPCFELSGDFYDLIRLGHSVGIVVGDVVGKGVAASLLMAGVRASLRAHVEDVYDIEQIMAKVNTALVGDARRNEFTTVFYGTLDPRQMRLTYCSAGHEPALLFREGRFTELGVGGMALGIDRTQTYDKAIVHLKPGDVLFAYTDGLLDASNFSGEKFGRHRIRQAVAEVADKDAQSIVNHVFWEARRFTGLNYRPDDITLLAAKVKTTE